MALACASRFALLRLDDDEIVDSSNKKTTNTQGSIKDKNLKQGASDTKSKSKKKKKAVNEAAELQNLAFGTSKQNKKSAQNNNKVVSVSQKQYEEWKQKDNEFVSETYEQDLQQALLLSKIDYEEKKDVYEAFQKESEQSKQVTKKKKKNNQKKEKGVMSLDEFQNLDSQDIESGSFSKMNSESPDMELNLKPKLDERNFFNKIEEDVEKIITKELQQDHHKTADPVKESARFLQFQEELRLKDEEIGLLKGTVEKLKDELKTVKSRNKKLCGILGSGEMKEKAEILIEIQQLLSVKEELTEQLNEYHTALEQERSKVHSLQTELKKFQGHKKRTESK